VAGGGGAAGVDGGDLGLDLGAATSVFLGAAWAFCWRAFSMAASIRARLASSPGAWRRCGALRRPARRRGGDLLAGGGGLGGELLGFFLLLAFLAEVLELEAVAGGVGGVFSRSRAQISLLEKRK
jgi:hypothetical protein